MTVRGVATQLEISASLVYRLISTGRLRCNRYGIGRGVIRVSEEQLAEYRASVEHGRQPDAPRITPRPPRLKHLRL